VTSCFSGESSIAAASMSQSLPIVLPVRGASEGPYACADINFISRGGIAGREACRVGDSGVGNVIDAGDISGVCSGVRPDVMVVWVPSVTGQEILLFNDLLSRGAIFLPTTFTLDPSPAFPSELNCSFHHPFLLPPRSSSSPLCEWPARVNSLRIVARRSGRSVAREAAMIPNPSSMHDHDARPRMWLKNVVFASARAGMYLKRMMDAIDPLFGHEPRIKGGR
jgi:hypothetical protein